jgi:molybdopterin-guanine dinucleotide biosynthesis protein A
MLLAKFVTSCDTPNRLCNFADELAEELADQQSRAFVGLKSEKRSEF